MICHLSEPFAAGKEGSISRFRAQDGARGICKQFKPRKSVARIHREANFQRRAAAKGVAPQVYYVDEDAKRIYMEEIPYRLIDVAEKGSLPANKTAEIVAIMDTLDEEGIMHNDGNALNLMVRKNGSICLIDYGLSRDIKPKDRRKYNERPNFHTTLFMLKRGLKQYGIHANFEA